MVLDSIDGAPPIDTITAIGYSDGTCPECADGVFAPDNPTRCVFAVGHEGPHRDFIGQEF
jgi:hypothetical protein